MAKDLVFIREGFTVLKKKRGKQINYIIINTKKEFEQGHTHLNSYQQVKYVIHCVNKKKIPKSFNTYLLVSLMRLTTDQEYADKIESLIEVRKQKGKKEKFVNQGGRKR